MNRKEEIIAQTLTLTRAGFNNSYAISQVLKRAKWLHGIYERQCNGHQDHNGNWDQAAAEKDEKREERIKKQILELFAHNVEDFDGDKEGLGDLSMAMQATYVEFQRDPRGAPLIVYKDGHELGRIWG